MKKFKIEIKWSIIFSAFTLLWIFVEKSLGLHDANIKSQILVSYLFAIPMILIYILELVDKKNNFYPKTITWNQGFITGIYLSFFIFILSPLTQYICFEIITPDYFKNAIDYVIASKMMKPEAAVSYFSIKNYIIQSAFSGISFGIITAAIVAYFLQTKIKKQ